MRVFWRFRRSGAAAIAVAALLSGKSVSASSPVPLLAPAAHDGDEARAQALVRVMTLDEKISMVHAAFGGSARSTMPDDDRLGAGYLSGVPRLGIPALFESDASLGIANGSNMRPGDSATALPAGLATGATFDPQLAFAGGALIGSEAKARGFNVLLAGGMNLVRDPWGGRDFEYFGEDVLHSAIMGAAHIRGVQSNGVISTIKHFAINAQETGRTVLSARIDPAALRESDLLAFEIAIERSQPGAVMCSYNRINGSYACENKALLGDTLKTDWKYSGWVMSDWGAVHSTVNAALAGLDQESGEELDAQIYFGAQLKQAVLDGKVSESRLDDMVTRILRSMSRMGLLDGGGADLAIDQEHHAALAQQVEEAGIVMLRNERGLLPLAQSTRSIAVIGAHADRGVLAGGGSSSVRSYGGTPIDEPAPNSKGMLALVRRIYHASSPMAALRDDFSGATISFSAGTDIAAAVAAARTSDVAVIFAEEWRSEMIDAETLSLPGNQDALIAAVAAVNPRTIVVLETGGPVMMPWLDQVGAVVEAWYPGQRGGQAIAAVLSGRAGPSGRLPVTFPATAEQAPRPSPPGQEAVKDAAARQPPTDVNAPDAVIDMTGGVAPFDVKYVEGADVGYRWYERQGERPLFPFGYGLSYTRFAYSDLRITGGHSPSVSVTVTNVGSVRGADVPQVYAAAMSRGRAIRRLVGFQKVDLSPGQSIRVTVAIDPRLVARFDTARRRWIVPGSLIPISVGRNAGDIVLQGEMTLPAQSLLP